LEESDMLHRIPRDLCCGRPHASEVAPPAALSPWVAFGWTHQPDGRTHRILADGEMDLMLALGGPLWVSGPRDRAVAGVFAPPTQLVGLRLQLGVGPRLLDVEPAALRNARAPLRDLGAVGRRIADRVEGAQSPQEALQALFLAIAPRTQAAPPDPAAAAVVALRRASDGQATLASARERLGLGERQLERRFKASVGLTAKTYARLARFQAAVALARTQPALRLGMVAAEAGYADQAHLAHEARVLGGTAPVQLRLPR
jgi:AraC-like DNA-binding protein